MTATAAGPQPQPVYRRVIRLRPEPARIDAEMIDYLHHFRVTVSHRDGVIIAAAASGVRVPWTTCPLGAAGVGRLVGHSLATAADPASWASDRSAQCVHALDLALLAVAHAADSGPTDLEIVVSPAAGVRREAVLRRNGEVQLAWTLQGTTVVAPERFAGLTMAARMFHPWVARRLDPPSRAEAIVLRRASYIAPSRAIDLDLHHTAGELNAADSSCYTFRPEVIATARRVRGSSRPTETVLDQ
jgi:Protein of unknown function (DUF2889)